MSNNNGILTIANPSMNTVITNVGSGGTGGSGHITVVDSTSIWSGGSPYSGTITVYPGCSWPQPDAAAYFNTVMEGQLSQDPDAFATSLNQILKNHPDLLEELQRKLDRDAMTNDLKDLIEGDEEQDTK